MVLAPYELYLLIPAAIMAFIVSIIYLIWYIGESAWCLRSVERKYTIAAILALFLLLESAIYLINVPNSHKHQQNCTSTTQTEQ